MASYYALALANAQLQDARRKADQQTKVALDMMSMSGACAFTLGGARTRVVHARARCSHACRAATRRTRTFSLRSIPRCRPRGRNSGAPEPAQSGSVGLRRRHVAALESLRTARTRAHHVAQPYPDQACVPAATRAKRGCDGRSQSVTDAETVPLLAAMFEQMGFVARYSIPYDTLVRFLLTVRRSYRKVPYHNWRCVPPPLSRCIRTRARSHGS